MGKEVNNVVRTEQEITNQTRRQRALERLAMGDFSTDPQLFLNSLLLSHHLPMLTIYSVEELARMQIYQVRGFKMGFALKSTEMGQEIVGVHNNEFSLKNMGHSLVVAALDLGGNHLDHFGTPKLNQLYGSVGLVEYHREPFDPIYDPDGEFERRYGQVSVIYRRLPLP